MRSVRSSKLSSTKCCARHRSRKYLRKGRRSPALGPRRPTNRGKPMVSLRNLLSFRLRQGAPLASVSSLLVAFALCGDALAQGDYPSRPIRFLVPLVPGGAADILARALGQKLTERLNQPFVIDNRPGAGQTLATEI